MCHGEQFGNLSNIPPVAAKLSKVYGNTSLRLYCTMFGQLVAEPTHTIRKRRRPALSCVECRRRKIKCDRNSPCNHCKQSKKAVCIYKEDHPAIGTGRVSNAHRTLIPSSKRCCLKQFDDDSTPLRLVRNMRLWILSCMHKSVAFVSNGCIDEVTL